MMGQRQRLILILMMKRLSAEANNYGVGNMFVINAFQRNGGSLKNNFSTQFSILIFSL